MLNSLTSLGQIFEVSICVFDAKLRENNLQVQQQQYIQCTSQVGSAEGVMWAALPLPYGGRESVFD